MHQHVREQGPRTKCLNAIVEHIDMRPFEYFRASQDAVLARGCRAVLECDDDRSGAVFSGFQFFLHSIFTPAEANILLAIAFASNKGPMDSLPLFTHTYTVQEDVFFVSPALTEPDTATMTVATAIAKDFIYTSSPQATPERQNYN